MNAPLQVKAGSVITISWTIENKGERETDETYWNDGVYLSEDGFFTPVGSYRIVLENPDGSSCSEEFDIVKGKGGEFHARLIIKNIVRPGRPYTLTLEYGNSGDADIPAPLVVISADDGVEMRLFPTEEFHTKPIQVLAIADENPVDILPPGSLYTIDMEFKLLGDQIVPFYITVMDQPDAPIDWDSMEMDFRPENIDQEVWGYVWQNLREQLGETWGSYVQVLRENASRLTLRNQPTYDVRVLFGLEMNVAYGGHKGAIGAYVFESDNHMPVGGVTVIAHQVDGFGHAESLTNKDGSYLLTGLQPGKYRLEVDRYLIDEGAFVDVFADVDTLAHFVYVTPGGEIVGYVEFNGVSIKSARILARGENTDTLYMALTDDEGYYQLQKLPEDTYIVEVEAEGYVKEKKAAFLLNRGEIRDDVHFNLILGYEITGKVTDMYGQPIENVYIWATNAKDDILYAIADENGEYRITGLSEGNWEVYTFAERFLQSETLIINIGHVVSIIQDFALVPGSSISGKITDSRGNPFTDASVFAEGAEGDIGSAVTDESGYYEITGLSQGTYTVIVQSNGYVEDRREIGELILGSSQIDINFSLTSLVTVSGIVTEVDNVTAISSAELIFQGSDGSTAKIVTEEDGTFENILAPDVYYLLIKASGHCDDHHMVEISPDIAAIDFTISLALAGSITGA